MMNTLDYIDAVAKTTETGTDYAAAKKLGITPSAVSNYRAHPGARGMNNEISIRAAKTIGRSPEVALIELQLERATNPEVKTTLKSILDKLSKTLASVALAATLSTLPEPAMAGNFGAVESPANHYYVKLIRFKR